MATGPYCPDSGMYYPEGTVRCPICGQALADDDKDELLTDEEIETEIRNRSRAS